MNDTSNETHWFWKLIDRGSNLITVFSAFWVTSIGLIGGLISTVPKFPLLWRVVTLLGSAILLFALLATATTFIRRSLLLRRLRRAAESGDVQAATMFKLAEGGSDLLLLGNVAEGVQTFFDSEGPVQGMQAADNVQRAGRRWQADQSQATTKPIRLNEDGLLELASKLQQTAQEIHEFLQEREQAEPKHTVWPLSRESWEEQTQASTRNYLETMSLYRQRFVGKVLALSDLAAENGFADAELQREVRHTTNKISIGMVADRLSAVAERIRLSNTR